MPILGAGSQPAGSSPAGGFFPAPQAAGGNVYPDPRTGQSLTGRLLDQRSHDVDYTSDGNRAQGMGTVQQIVQIAWTTLDTSSLKVFDAGYAQRIVSLYTSAVQDLITRKMLEIVSFDVKRFNTGGVRTTIRWRDLTTGVEHPFTV